MAERLITLDRYDEAEQWAARAEPVYSPGGVLHFRLAERYLARDRHADAIRHLEKSIQFDPGRVEVEYALGETLLDESRPREAASHLRRAFEAGFRRDQSGLDLVRAFGAIGNRDAALAILRQLRPAQNADAQSWLTLGELAMQLRAPEDAAEFFRGAISARPELSTGYFDLAASEMAMGRIPDARIHVQQALKLNPNDERARRLEQMLK
jgi:tetratricopeptide (TPR) repeat protein